MLIKAIGCLTGVIELYAEKTSTAVNAWSFWVILVYRESDIEGIID